MQFAGAHNVHGRLAGPLALAAAVTLTLAPGAMAAAPKPKPTAEPRPSLAAHRTAGEDSRGMWAAR
jgi:hypothetical protein